MPDLLAGHKEQESLRRAPKSATVESPVPEADRALPQLTASALARGASSAGVRAAMNPASLMAMQRLAGNQATLRALRHTSVQRVGILEAPAPLTDEETDEQATGGAASAMEEAVAAGTAGSASGAPGGSGEPPPAGGGAKGEEIASAVEGSGLAGGAGGGAKGEEIASAVEGSGLAGGAGGGDVGGSAAESEEIPAAPEPADVAITELTQLGEQAPEIPAHEVEQPAPPQQEQPENLGAGAGEIERQAQGGGGIVDALINRAVSAFRGIAGAIGGGVRTAASGIASRAAGFFGQAFSFATSLVSRVTDGIRGIATGIATEIRTHLGSLKEGVRGIVGSVLGAVRGVMGQVGGAIRDAVTAILSGRPVLPTLLAPFRAMFDSLFGGITGRITAIIERIRGVIDGAINRVLQTILSMTQWIINGITFLGTLLTTAAAFLQQELVRLTGWVAEQVAGLPDVLRTVITAIVNAVVAAARRIINNIVTRAQAFLDRVIARVVDFVQSAVGLVTRIATAIRNTATTVFDLVAAGVRTVANALNRVKTWLLGKIAAAVSRAMRTVLDPIAERLKQRLLSLIGPAAGEAIRQAQLMFPNGLPAPQEVVAAAARGASEVASEAGSAILQGLTNPEGDHIGFGIQLGGGGSLGGPAGASGTATAMFDIVLDYRRNDIGFFLSPGAGGAGSLGIGGGAAGGVGVAASWGTVANFGDPSNDVLAAYGGWFTNVSYGVSGGVADVVGGEASTGGSIYRGGATPGIPVFSYTPLGADRHPVPGTGTAPVTTPGTTTPGTPDAPGTLPLGEVRFPSQVGDVASAPGGPGAVDTAATAVRDYPSTTPRGEVTQVDVLGEASRVWRRPRPGRSRAAENADLATARARSVAGRLRGLIPGITVTEHGNGDLRAAAAGKSEGDASPEDRRASMLASTVVRGTPATTTPGTTTPGTPPATAGQQHTFELGSGPNPFQARQTTGWDTTASAMVTGGAEAQVGLYGGVGASYSVPLGKAHMDPETMRMIRILTGVMKLIADVETLSPLGFIRDALGLAAAFPERDAVISEMTSAVTDWAIPMPPGAAPA